jgi:hypothetical protein
MANQNKTAFQATVDSLSPDNASGEVSPADLRTLEKNLSDSVLHKNTTITTIGSNPTAWDVGSYDYVHVTSIYSTNTTLTLSNTVDGGRYVLRVNKSGVDDVLLTIACSESPTIKHPNNKGFLTMSGDDGQFFLIEFQRQGSILYTYDLLNPTVSGTNGGSLGANPTTWDLTNSNYKTNKATISGNLSIDMSNAALAGRYYLFFQKTTASDVTITLTYNAVPVTFFGESLSTNTVTITAPNFKHFVIKVYNWAANSFFAEVVTNPGSLLDEDNMVSDSNLRGATQQSIKAYVDGLMRTIKVSVSSAEILTSNSAAKELLPAAGADTFIEIQEFTYRYIYGTIAYTNASNLKGSYSASSSVGATSAFALTAANDQIGLVSRSDYLFNVTTDVINKGIYLHQTASDPASGDGTLDIFITYRIIDLS